MQRTFSQPYDSPNSHVGASESNIGIRNQEDEIEDLPWLALYKRLHNSYQERKLYPQNEEPVNILKLIAVHLLDINPVIIGA